SHRPGASAAKLRLEAARPVVHPGVDHARIVPALVGGDPVLLLQHRHCLMWILAGQLVRRRQTDDAGPDPHVVGHGPEPTAGRLPPPSLAGPAGPAGLLPRSPQLTVTCPLDGRILGRVTLSCRTAQERPGPPRPAACWRP